MSSRSFFICEKRPKFTILFYSISTKTPSFLRFPSFFSVKKLRIYRVFRCFQNSNFYFCLRCIKTILLICATFHNFLEFLQKIVEKFPESIIPGHFLNNFMPKVSDLPQNLGLTYAIVGDIMQSQSNNANNTFSTVDNTQEGGSDDPA